MNEAQAIAPCRPPRRGPRTARRAASALLSALLLLLPSAAFAQKRVTNRYPARNNVRLHLNNRSGTITVEAWNKPEIRIAIEMESPSARVAPEVNDDGLFIDVERDNRGRPDVGDVNFRINVPVNSMVDLETKRGNITVRGVEGAMMRAKVTTEGDIELTGIRSQMVVAENIMGNILFDAELLDGGTYELKSTQGDIQLRINADAGFRLTATAPRTRNINVNGFAGRGQFEFFNDKRKVIGKVGNGGAKLNTTNTLGSISIAPRTR